MKSKKAKKMTLEDFAKLFQEESAKFIAHMDESFARYKSKEKARALERSTIQCERMISNHDIRLKMLEEHAFGKYPK